MKSTMEPLLLERHNTLIKIIREGKIEGTPADVDGETNKKISPGDRKTAVHITSITKAADTDGDIRQSTFIVIN